MSRKFVAGRIVIGMTLLISPVAFSGDYTISLDDLSKRALVTVIKPVAVDGKRVVAENHRVGEVAGRLCEQFGGRLKSVDVEFENPIHADETVSYHDGFSLRQVRLNCVERFAAFESVVCVGLVLEEENATAASVSRP